ncbi:sigma-70 family RNA polymerase sigma factor [Chitinophaga japonensis]|uniref:RNA polymerase sigma-70 factor (ECF subfamily) n=1 Tax=Chitinophaga japonensis TaxID=104662 RepID=A0A562T280_CHIJA|nr:sigma-70 family RNA polymerase sigma factor [Chitinophaga japonensis]TWI87785.1 RNA polymerase sigma-70 factor (ECF subfamily) [Chitinophaga japonensis]
MTSENFNEDLASRQEIFKIIYDRYYGSIFWQAHRLLDDREKARDVAHDVFMNLWFKGGSLEIENVLWYLTRACKNTCLNIINRKKTERTVVDRVQASEPVREDPHFSEDFQIREYINEALMDLPERWRLAFHLVFTHNKSYAESAAEMNISRNTFKSIMKSTLQRIREKLIHLK